MIAPYIFLSDGKVRHCGTKHLDLLREGGRRRVPSVTWSQRSAGCPAR